MHILYGFLAIAAGIGMIFYSTQIVKVFGHQDWAERYLGPAGTYTAWKAIGFIFVIGGFYLMVH